MREMEFGIVASPSTSDRFIDMHDEVEKNA
jgi:hypothetical protein